MAKENKIRIVKMKAWQWPDPAGNEGDWQGIINIDEQQMTNTTFSDGAHGEGDTNDFVMLGLPQKPSRSRFYLGFGGNRLHFFFSCGTFAGRSYFLVALDTKAMFGGYMYQKNCDIAEVVSVTGLLDRCCYDMARLIYFLGVVDPGR